MNERDFNISSCLAVINPLCTDKALIQLLLHALQDRH